MSKETEELLVQFKEWIAFTKQPQNYPESVWNSSIEEGKWSVRDIVSHIMLWDKYYYEEAIEKIKLKSPITLKNLDYKPFNNNAITYGRSITIDELIQKTIDYREKIIQVIEGLDEESKSKNYQDADGKVFNILEYLRDFVGHDQHHMTQMKEYMAQYKGLN